jgi:predicted ATPase
VHDVTFQQQLQSAATGIDSRVLAEELERLREELAQRAGERDQYAALVAVTDAAADAREGQTASALAKLSAVGRWALDMANKIGVTVAAEAIKRAAGLG